MPQHELVWSREPYLDARKTEGCSQIMPIEAAANIFGRGRMIDKGRYFRRIAA